MAVAEEEKIEVLTETLADYIGRKMAERRMDSVGQLSVASGVSVSTLAPIVNGNNKQPKARTLRKIAAGLHVSYESLARAAGGLPPEREEPAPERTPKRQELDSILDSFDDVEQEEAAEILKSLKRVADRRGFQEMRAAE